MIRLRGVSHALNGKTILSGVDLDIPTDRRVALLGRKAEGKSTLISLIGGIIMPDAGRIEREAQVSFPAGFQGAFRLTHTGRRNIRFAGRAYGADPGDVFDFVRAVTGFGDLLDAPMRNISLQNRISVAYALVYALPFDVYLFDNVVGPIAGEIPGFHALCQEMFDRRMEEAGAILATRNPYVASKFCDCAVVMRDAGLTFYDNLHDGLAAFEPVAAAYSGIPLPNEADYAALGFER